MVSIAEELLLYGENGAQRQEKNDDFKLRKSTVFENLNKIDCHGGGGVVISDFTNLSSQ